jgi:hypothetical protein
MLGIDSHGQLDGVCMDSMATCMHGVDSHGQLDGVNVSRVHASSAPPLVCSRAGSFCADSRRVSSSATRSTAVNLAGHLTASGGMQIPVGHPITPLRSPHVLRSGGSPHMGETPPRFPSTLVCPGSPSYEEVIAFGGIPDYSNVGLRSCSRIQA